MKDQTILKSWKVSNNINEKISRFLKKQTCAGICCLNENGNPYCFSCFYVFNPENGFLYFKSSASSRHASYLKQNPYVSGTIQPDKLNLFVVKGIQFEGIILNADENVKKMAAKEYYFQYPVALTMQGDIWIIQLENIRLTDSTIGFGKKIYWNKNEVISKS